MARILIIDDEEELRDMLRLTLEAVGHDIEMASDGQDGLERYREKPADLVITDIVMPRKDGLETIEELRRDHPDVKIIALAAYGDSLLPMATDLGADDAMRKPFSRRDLLEAVDGLLGENR